MSLLAWVRRRNPGTAVWQVWWWMGVLQPLMWLALRVFWGFRCWGARRIPATGPTLLICNHQSYLDLGVLGAGIWHRHFHSMARSTLFKPGFFGWLIRSLNAFPVEQGKGDIKALRTAIRLLNEGHLVLVFPEGSRSRDGRLQPFAEGLMLLIRRAKPRVVPMAVDGVFDVWPMGRKLPRLHGRVGAAYGEAIEAEQLLAMPPDKAVTLLAQRVDQIRLDVRAKLRRASRGKYPMDRQADQSVFADGASDAYAEA